jgi:uncharacterized protein
MIKKLVYISAGSITLLLGIIGICIPGLPTTPFLLLTAWFYVRSSDKLYSWLINHRIFGKYIKNFQNGISVRTKIISIAIMWTMISISVFIFIESIIISYVVIGVGIIGTIVMSRIKQTKTNKLENTSKIENIDSKCCHEGIF